MWVLYFQRISGEEEEHSRNRKTRKLRDCSEQGMSLVLPQRRASDEEFRISLEISARFRLGMI